MTATPSPTPPDDRILGIDVLRGFALLGILIINIRVFAMPFATLNNPTAYGDLTGLNYVVWFLGHVFAQQKFITLFTLLFGAGILLFAERKPDSLVKRLHRRRMLFLLVVGLAHAYLLWFGDILVPYAICGFVVLSARHWEPSRLARLGLLLVVVPSLLYVVSGLSLEPGTQLAAGWAPSEAAIAEEVATYQGGWIGQLEHRAEVAFSQHTSGFVSNIGWRTTGLMLLGMALYKWGVLSNDRSNRFYYRLLAVGGVGGLTLILTGVWYVESVDWVGREALFFGSQFNYWGSLLLAGAYIAAIMLLSRRLAGSALTTALSAVGRTAFSNYLLQTLLATSIFYGHGLGLFGTVSRVEQIGIVVGIWALQIVLSVLWLRYYRYGPMEWLWRRATYGS